MDRQIINIALIVSTLIFTSLSCATDLNLSSKPLFLGEGIEPNVMMTLDDSGSMQWEVMPSENQYYTTYMFPMPSNLYGGVIYVNQVPNYNDNNVHNFFQRSSHNNVLYYDPDITYYPWSEADGTSMGDANPKAALYNPVDSSIGSIDLTAQQTGYACWFSHTSNLNSAWGDPCYGNHSYWPITYYTFNSGSVTARTSYTKVQITSSTAASTTYTSPNGTVRTRDEEIQNFANWFQYYRSRILAARAGIGRAFAQQGTGMRVGFSAINQGSTTVDGVTSSSAVVNGLRNFSGTNRTNFFDALYGRVINNYGTPLRSALNNVGKYFERSDNKGPWAANPGTADTTTFLTCRQSYNILMTDGYWNGSSPSLGNVDNTSGTTISAPDATSYSYTPENPYMDSWSNTLADVGMYYWKRDLLSGVDNEVAATSSDPAFWQHLVNYTVGLGVNGTLDPDNDIGALTSGSKTWPEPSADAVENIDDLWHTAVNSRGEFFSATDPDTFADALTNILSSISSRQASASASAVSVATLSNGGKVYQATFNSVDWSGDLKAYTVDATGLLDRAYVWSAAEQIPSESNRVIITYDGMTGQPFQWSDISSSQQTSLGSSAVLDYLRGDQSSEISNGGSYRSRSSTLGDIIHSNPLFVGVPSSNYSDNWGSGEAESSVYYSSFVSNNVSRQSIIYAGANDGMLHAFNADTGVEVFAYVPSSVYSKLDALTDTTYSHDYYVDGAVSASDVFFSSDSQWHTVLVGSLRAGGQGVYALDITDPTSYANEASAKTKVLWEYTDSNDSDLGYTFGEPQIARLQNGKWAAIFSGGYNNTSDDDNDGTSTNDSTTGDATLYVVNIEDGSLIKKFDTKVGMSEDPTSNNRPNGLATPFIADFDNDDIADAIYVGDLFGNVWKIDISASSIGSWDFAYKSGGKPQPIYTACYGSTCNGTNVQPITAQIKATRHPSTTGSILIFGTGKYFETDDNDSTSQVTQTLYGIWDKDESSLTAFSRDDLLQQQVLVESTVSNKSVRVTSDNVMDWNSYNGWYMDLYNTQNSNTNNYGERIIANVHIRYSYVIVTSVMPSADSCDPSGSSWIMALDKYSGSRLNYSAFDINGDSSFSTADYLSVDIDNDGTLDVIPVTSVGGEGLSTTTTVGMDSDTDALVDSNTYTTYDYAGYDTESECEGAEGRDCEQDASDGKWRSSVVIRLNKYGQNSRISWHELDFNFR